MMLGTLDLGRRLHKSSNRRFNSREECDGLGRSWSNVGIRGSLRRRDNICSHQIPFSSLSWGRTPFGADQEGGIILTIRAPSVSESVISGSVRWK